MKVKGKTSKFKVGGEAVFVGEKNFHCAYSLTVGKKYKVQDIGEEMPGIKAETLHFLDNDGRFAGIGSGFFKPVKG
jgi:hypothetical protein